MWRLSLWRGGPKHSYTALFTCQPPLSDNQQMESRSARSTGLEARHGFSFKLRVTELRCAAARPGLGFQSRKESSILRNYKFQQFSSLLVGGDQSHSRFVVVPTLPQPSKDGPSCALTK